MDLLAAHNTPFAVALVLLLLLLGIHLAGFGDFGPDLDGDVDIDGVEGANVLGGLASLMGLGRLPLMAWLSIFLGSFGLLGLTMQQILTNLFNAPLPPLLATGAGALIGLPVTSLLSRPLGAIWPRDETTAVSVDALLGKRGTIALGSAKRGHPARAQVSDHFGMQHNVMVEPADNDVVLVEGDEVLLVRREDNLFFAVGTNGPIRLTS